VDSARAPSPPPSLPKLPRARSAKGGIGIRRSRQQKSAFPRAHLWKFKEAVVPHHKEEQDAPRQKKQREGCSFRRKMVVRVYTGHSVNLSQLRSLGSTRARR
jgi:hypothetical protein